MVERKKDPLEGFRGFPRFPVIFNIGEDLPGINLDEPFLKSGGTITGNVLILGRLKVRGKTKTWEMEDGKVRLRAYP